MRKNIKYLGVVIDCHLNWKAHISYLTKKLNRNIGALSKLRHFVTTDILTNLYYSLLYPFFTYGLIAWGNTYSTTINPLFILQKKAIRIITFSYYREHTNLIFSKLNILKLPDLIFFTMQSLCTITIIVIYLVSSIYSLQRLVKHTVTTQD